MFLGSMTSDELRQAYERDDLWHVDYQVMEEFHYDMRRKPLALIKKFIDYATRLEHDSL